MPLESSLAILQLFFQGDSETAFGEDLACLAQAYITADGLLALGALVTHYVAPVFVETGVPRFCRSSAP